MTDKKIILEEEDVKLEQTFLDDVDVKLSDYSFEDYVALFLFWVLAGVVFAQFFSRYVLNDSIAWTEEIARYLLIAVAFTGAPIAVRKNTHIHVEFFYRFINRPVARAMSTLVDIIRVVFFAYASVISFKMIKIMHVQYMTSLDVPMSVIYVVVLGGFVLMTMRAVQVLVRHWRQGYSVLDHNHYLNAAS